MATYIILSRFSPDAFSDPKDLRKLADEVSAKIRTECRKVRWKDSYATMGRFDVVDIVESDDPQEVMRAAMLLQAYGHARTETLPATPWKEFLKKL
jgi:uncharacterized protein with GYD domain